MLGMKLFQQNLESTVARLEAQGRDDLLKGIQIQRINGMVYGNIDETIVCPSEFGLDGTINCLMTDADCKSCWADALAKDYDMTPKQDNYDLAIEAFNKLTDEEVINFAELVATNVEIIESITSQELSELDRLRKKYGV